MSAISKMLNPDENPVKIRFIRHSPGRRRNSELTMYDVSCETKEMSELVRAGFAKYRRRQNPVSRPPELADVNVHPLVRLVFLKIVSWCYSCIVPYVSFQGISYYCFSCLCYLSVAVHTTFKIFVSATPSTSNYVSSSLVD